MISRFSKFISSTSNRLFFQILLFTSLLVYGARGARFNRTIWGDDLELLNQTLSHSWQRGFLDHFGLFEKFNGYLILFTRIFIRFAMLGERDQFTINAYVLMTFYFAFTTAGTCIIVARKTSRPYSLLALFFCLFMPFSNQVMLAQINTVIWPSSLLIIVIVAARIYPHSLSGKLLLVLFLALISLSTLTTIIALMFIAIGLIQDYRKPVKFEMVLFFVASVGLFVQFLSYTPRSNPKLSLINELYKSLYNFSPQFIREKVGLPLNADEQIIFWVVPLILLIIWITQAHFALNNNWEQFLLAIKLFAGGIILLCLLIRGNGWFNTHYIFIPASMFWISLVILFHANRDEPSTRIALPVSLILFGTSISGVYYLL